MIKEGIAKLQLTILSTLLLIGNALRNLSSCMEVGLDIILAELKRKE